MEGFRLLVCRVHPLKPGHFDPGYPADLEPEGRFFIQHDSEVRFLIRNELTATPWAVRPGGPRSRLTLSIKHEQGGEDERSDFGSTTNAVRDGNGTRQILLVQVWPDKNTTIL